jgi:hypothetical protein
MNSWHSQAFGRLQQHPSLEEALADPGTLLLYPGPGAEDIETMPPLENGRPRTLIVVDGTWRQAGRVMRETKSLQLAIDAGTVRRVQFAEAGKSGYQFRKEPHDYCLSTLESVAYTLRFLERGPDGQEAVQALLRTFRLMVQLQTSHIKGKKRVAPELQAGDLVAGDSAEEALGTAAGGGRAGLESWLQENPVGNACAVAIRRPYALFRTETDHRTGRSKLIQDREVMVVTYDEAALVCKRINAHRQRGTRLTVLPLPPPPGTDATLFTSADARASPASPPSLASSPDSSSPIGSAAPHGMTKLSQQLGERLSL